MKKQFISILRKALLDQRGQVIPWTGFMILTILGMSGLVVDVGRAYIAHTQLQNTVNAAALAAAGSVYVNSTTNGAAAVATNYSAGSGDENANVGLGALSTPTVSTICLNLLEPSGSTCSTGSAANAVKVTQSTTIKTFFMPIIFGPKTLSVGATAMASMQGMSQPWNVAIIVDATDSMVTNTDSNCGGTGSLTRFQCALNGVSTLLQAVTPCATASKSSCTTSIANFRVSLWAFPNVYRSQVSDDWGCANTIPGHLPYTMDNTQATSYNQLLYSGAADYATYEVTGPYTSSALSTSTSLPTDADANGFLSDYYDPTTTNGLNSSSVLVKAIGAASSGCAHAMNTDGGESTYYGSVIYAAQAALDAEWKAYGGQNAMILLSDGQANAGSGKLATGTVTPTGDGIASLTSTGVYPSLTDECQQAIAAAQSAATSWTSGSTTYPASRVYAVAYGSESTGCTGSSGTDSSTLSSVSTSKLNQSYTISSGSNQLTPCITMENIASSLNYFYSDYNQSGSASSCQDSSHTVTQLNDIFLAIASDFTTPRLLPNNAT